MKAPRSEQRANRTLTSNAGRDYTRESRKWWNRFYFWKWNLTVYYMKRCLFARTKVSLLFSLLRAERPVFSTRVNSRNPLPRFPRFYPSARGWFAFGVTFKKRIVICLARFESELRIASLKLVSFACPVEASITFFKLPHFPVFLCLQESPKVIVHTQICAVKATTRSGFR